MTDTYADYAERSEIQPESETDPFSLERYRQFRRFLPPRCSLVLDVGCNTGRGGAELCRLSPGLRLVGLDCNKRRLDQLPSCYERRIEGLSMNIPEKDETFDAVVAGEFVEHLAPMDVDPSLAEFFRILNIGGRLLLTTPNPSSIVSRILKRSVLGRMHLTQHHIDCLRLRLRMIGFSHVKIYGSGRNSRYLGMYCPVHSLYSSYLVVAEKR